MKKLTWISILVSLAPTLLLAQIEMAPSVIASSGAYSENENFSISWTLGEIAITSLYGENMILTQGFHQALDLGTGIKKSEINWNISVYPNPVENELKVQFDLFESNAFLLEIQDVTGRIILQEIYSQVQPEDLVILNTSGLVCGVYFLRILNTDTQQVKVSSLRKL